MSRRLVLLTGQPGSGKSTFAQGLVERFGFVVVHVDSVYLDFVQSEWECLFFGDLRKWIGPHYLMLRHHLGES